MRYLQMRESLSFQHIHGNRYDALGTESREMGKEYLYTTEAPPPATMVQILPRGFSRVSLRLAPLLASRSAM